MDRVEVSGCILQSVRVVVVAIASAGAVLAQTGSITLISKSTAGASSTGAFPALSHDGRYVVFESASSTLVAGDTNGRTDVFVRDRQSGTTSRVSTTSSGAQSNGHSYDPSISGDGRYVAFQSYASDLVSGDTNAIGDIFLKDLQTGATTLISVTTAGVQADGVSSDPAISGDGDTIVFASQASNLASPDAGIPDDVFVRDLVAGTTTRISVAPSGAGGDDYSSAPSVSFDGRYVAYQSDAGNLVPGDTNQGTDIFLHDRTLATTVRISVGPGGQQFAGGSHYPSISDDGRYIAYSGFDQVFRYDALAGVTDTASVDGIGTPGNDLSDIAEISDDGQVVSFHARAWSLVARDDNANWDVFVHDFTTQTTSIVSVSSTGQQSSGGAIGPSSLSGDGRLVVFTGWIHTSPTVQSSGLWCHDRGAFPTRIYGSPKLTGLGCIPAIAAVGSPSASSAAGFSIVADELENQNPTQLVYSTSGAVAQPFHGGTLYVASPRRRAGAQSSGGTLPLPFNCSGKASFDFNTRIASGVDPALVAGQHVWAQYWGRDRGFAWPDNYMLSAAVEFDIEP